MSEDQTIEAELVSPSDTESPTPSQLALLTTIRDHDKAEWPVAIGVEFLEAWHAAQATAAALESSCCIRLTASGKVRRQHAGKRHGMIKRTNKFIRNARGTTRTGNDTSVTPAPPR